MVKPRVLIAAGGTGGHVFPALAIAEELRRAGAEVIWLGAGGMEREIVRKRGWPLYIAPFRAPRGIVGGLRLFIAVLRALAILRRVRPAVVLGMGGYASVPGGVAARIWRLPLLIHEQNAVAGRANRFLLRFASRALSGFPGALPNAQCLGNPVRRDFAVKPAADAAADAESHLHLLVLGGSQGARALNTTVPAALALLGDADPAWRVTHQCGAGNAAAVRAAYQGGDVAVHEFIDDVAAAVAAADLVVCRAGASTLAELSAAAAAAVLIPYPHAAADHQTANARFFAARDAAVFCPQARLTPAWLADFLRRIRRDELAGMRARIAALAMPAAASDIAACCLREAKNAA